MSAAVATVAVFACDLDHEARSAALLDASTVLHAVGKHDLSTIAAQRSAEAHVVDVELMVSVARQAARSLGSGALSSPMVRAALLALPELRRR